MLREWHLCFLFLARVYLHFPSSRAAVRPINHCSAAQARSLCEDLGMHKPRLAEVGNLSMSLLEILKWSSGTKFLVLLMPHFLINATKIYVKGLPEC